jgi:hypothetical protein
MTAHYRLTTASVAFFTFCVCVLMWLCPAPSLAEQRSSTSSHRGPPLPPTTAEVDKQRRKQELESEKRKLRLEQAKRELKAAENRLRPRMPSGFSENPGARDNSAFRGHTAPELPPFNPAAAPPAEECLRAYFAAAKEATSMDQLLEYLPHEEQKTLRERQANHDPRKAAASQDRLRKKDPDMSEEQITFLTNSPYANALARHKKRANKFLDVLSAKSDGNKATVVISTLSMARSLGQEYPYSKATIEMVGEAGYWRIDTYNDSSWHYKEPPTTP